MSTLAKLIGAARRMATDPITLTDADVPDDNDSATTAFDEPMFIHAAQLGLRWEEVMDQWLAHDLVLRVVGNTVGGEPVTIDIGIRGGALETIAGTLRTKFIEWLRDYAAEDSHNYEEWESNQ